MNIAKLSISPNTEDDDAIKLNFYHGAIDSALLNVFEMLIAGDCELREYNPSWKNFLEWIREEWGYVVRYDVDNKFTQEDIESYIQELSAAVQNDDASLIVYYDMDADEHVFLVYSKGNLKPWHELSSTQPW